MLTVADVMTRRPVMVTAEATVTEALDRMKEAGISSVLVSPPVHSTRYGIVTASDVLSKVVKDDLDPDVVELGDIMTWRLVTAQAPWTLQQAAEVMTTAGVRRLPVLEGGEIVGLISDTDIFVSLAPEQEWETVRQVRKERAIRRGSLTGPAKTVADLMSTPVLAISPGAPVQEAIEKMVAGGVSSLLVSEYGEGPQGIITKRDVVTKVVALHRDAPHVKVGEISSGPVRTITPGASVEECTARMAAERVRRFPVADEPPTDSWVLGIISDSDILAAVEAHRWSGMRGRRVPSSYIVADVMRPPTVKIEPVWAESVSPELSLWDAAAKLSHAGVRQLPVVQQGQVIGTVSDTDILRALEERGGGD